MNYLNFTLTVFILLLFGCNQKGSQSNSATDNELSDTLVGQIIKEEQFEGNEELKQDQIENINNLIALFKAKNIEEIASKVAYPLSREYPIPSIKNKEEFEIRFADIFDENLIDKIANSNIEEWSEVGWRGVMLDEGAIWISDSDGKITAVNYTSGFEKKQRQGLIQKDKNNLHASIKTFESPTYKFKTQNNLIRIDELLDGNYRYVSWKVGEKESSKPDLMLQNGELDFDGSGGNHVITFENGNYIYNVYRNIIGEEDFPDITVVIKENGKTILKEDGILYLE